MLLTVIAMLAEEEMAEDVCRMMLLLLMIFEYVDVTKEPEINKRDWEAVSSVISEGMVTMKYPSAGIGLAFLKFMVMVVKV
jgi:hypothetical protein